MGRQERRKQILEAATSAFARAGFAATAMDDVVAEAGISRAILYRHFESKRDLYRAVLDGVCARFSVAVGEAPGAYTEAAIDALLVAAAADPDGFRLLFQHVAQEPDFRDFADRFRSSMTATAHQQIAEKVADQAWARWAAQLAPTVAVQAVMAWLDAGQPDPDQAGERVRAIIHSVIAIADRP